MDVDRDVSPATLNNCRETTSAIFSFRTDEQNGRQSVRTDAAVLRTDTFSWRTDEKPFERMSEQFERMSQYFEQMLMYFERICKPFERFVERFERIFSGVRTDDERITNGLAVRTDNRLCPFCLSRSQICMYHANKSKFWCLAMAGKDTNSSLTITKSRKKNLWLPFTVEEHQVTPG